MSKLTIEERNWIKDIIANVHSAIFTKQELRHLMIYLAKAILAAR